MLTPSVPTATRPRNTSPGSPIFGLTKYDFTFKAKEDPGFISAFSKNLYSMLGLHVAKHVGLIREEVI